MTTLFAVPVTNGPVVDPNILIGLPLNIPFVTRTFALVGLIGVVIFVGLGGFVAGQLERSVRPFVDPET